jgi:hypothetical protein
MKTTYNFSREARERLVLEAQVKAVGITLAVVLFILVYAKIANAIIPQ